MSPMSPRSRVASHGLRRRRSGRAASTLLGTGRQNWQVAVAERLMPDTPKMRPGCVAWPHAARILAHTSDCEGDVDAQGTMQIGTEERVAMGGMPGALAPAEQRPWVGATQEARAADEHRQIVLLTLAAAGVVTLAWTGLLVWLGFKAAAWLLS